MNFISDYSAQKRGCSPAGRARTVTKRSRRLPSQPEEENRRIRQLQERDRQFEIGDLERPTDGGLCQGQNGNGQVREAQQDLRRQVAPV